MKNYVTNYRRTKLLGRIVSVTIGLTLCFSASGMTNNLVNSAHTQRL